MRVNKRIKKIPDTIRISGPKSLRFTEIRFSRDLIPMPDCPLYFASLQMINITARLDQQINNELKLIWSKKDNSSTNTSEIPDKHKYEWMITSLIDCLFRESIETNKQKFINNKIINNLYYWELFRLPSTDRIDNHFFPVACRSIILVLISDRPR